MIKWADGERGAREARELRDATNFRLGFRRRYPNPNHYTNLRTEYELAYNAEKAKLPRKSKAALHWFAEFSEGVMGWVPKPSPLVFNALIDAIEQWLDGAEKE